MCGDGRACACLAMSVHVRRVFRSWRRFVFRFLLPVCRSASRRAVSLSARLSVSDFLSVFLSVSCLSIALSFFRSCCLSLALSVVWSFCRLVLLSFLRFGVSVVMALIRLPGSARECVCCSVLLCTSLQGLPTLSLVVFSKRGCTFHRNAFHVTWLRPSGQR